MENISVFKNYILKYGKQKIINGEAWHHGILENINGELYYISVLDSDPDIYFIDNISTSEIKKIDTNMFNLNYII